MTDARSRLKDYLHQPMRQIMSVLCRLRFGLRLSMPRQEPLDIRQPDAVFPSRPIARPAGREGDCYEFTVRAEYTRAAVGRLDVDSGQERFDLWSIILPEPDRSDNRTGLRLERPTKRIPPLPERRSLFRLSIRQFGRGQFDRYAHQREISNVIAATHSAGCDLVPTSTKGWPAAFGHTCRLVRIKLLPPEEWTTVPEPQPSVASDTPSALFSKTTYEILTALFSGSAALSGTVANSAMMRKRFTMDPSIEPIPRSFLTRKQAGRPPA